MISEEEFEVIYRRFLRSKKRSKNSLKLCVKDRMEVCLRAKFTMFLISTAVNSDFTKSFHRSKLRVMQLQNAIT